jgi:hypothetical protein
VPPTFDRFVRSAIRNKDHKWNEKTFREWLPVEGRKCKDPSTLTKTGPCTLWDGNGRRSQVEILTFRFESEGKVSPMARLPH